MTAKNTGKNQEKLLLNVEKRDIVGKKVKALRTEGKIPANIYGKDMASMAIQANAKEFMKVLHAAGLTQVIYVHVDKQEIPSMIQNVQMDPVTDMYIHADFKKVNLLVKIEAHVPVTVTGESEAVAQGKGDMLTLVSTLTVEALPTDVPQEIQIDISGLKEIDDAITVADIKAVGGFVILDEAETVIVRIAEHKEESTEPETESAIPGAEGEEGAAEGEAPAEGAAEGDAAPAEGDDKADEKAAEEKPAKE